MEKNFLSLIKTRRSALDYPAQEAGQPAARKQNYIVRTICGEEGKHADQ